MSTLKEPVFGVIGAGFIGSIHLAALQAAGLRVAAVADPFPAALAKVDTLAPGDDPHDPHDPHEDLVEFVEVLVRFSTEDVVRHQLLFQRTLPGFEPSPDSYALALEFYQLAQARLAAAGATDPEDVDLFSALVNGLAHQQVANDPGGDRWVHLARRAVDMFLADVDRHRRTTHEKGA